MPQLSGWFSDNFFFQAEDGIRDTSVTGVQTCALPIWVDVPAFQVDDYGPIRYGDARTHGFDPSLPDDEGQIGRASCRERV